MVFFIWDYISCKTLGWKKGRIFNPKDATNNAAVSPDWRYLFHCSREKIPFHHWNLKKMREQKTACRAVLRLIKKLWGAERKVAFFDHNKGYTSFLVHLPLEIICDEISKSSGHLIEIIKKINSRIFHFVDTFSFQI